MKSHTHIERDQPQANLDQDRAKEKVLCPHCLRTATNGLKCKGICVADDEY